MGAREGGAGQSGVKPTRRQLIEATIDVIYHEGFSAATVSEVARAAGVTTALQHHFPSRDDPIVQVIDSIREGVEREMEKGFAADSSVRKRVEDIFNLYWKVFGGRHYIAAVQIQLGTMRNRHLFALVSRAIEKTEKRRTRAGQRRLPTCPCRRSG